ncbi:Fpg/Nei family DNA glycosylase [Aeromicrobium sp.]|uniref:Fpg/Nei family DNA glycosylase n=1 Tax=Aeromicrobium sp. TaxID=1871063 RepID=UPI003D6BCAF5
MPEGHTLHRVAAELREHFAGRVVASTSPQGRFTAGAARVDRRRLLAAEAWGKHLLLRFEDVAESVHVHLGLFGGWTITTCDEEPEVVGQVRWRLRSGAVTSDLRGPTACELLTPGECASLLARLGPDPLRDDADPDDAWRRVSTSRASVATLLMDQSAIAGVGNVYRAEVLFRHRLPPDLPGRELDRTTWDAVWTDLRDLMRAGVRSGRIDTVRSEHTPEAMGRDPRIDAHGGEVYVYRRAGLPCMLCGNGVLTRIVGGRKLFWCPACQRADRLTS